VYHQQQLDSLPSLLPSVHCIHIILFKRLTRKRKKGRKRKRRRKDEEGREGGDARFVIRFWWGVARQEEGGREGGRMRMIWNVKRREGERVVFIVKGNKRTRNSKAKKNNYIDWLTDSSRKKRWWRGDEETWNVKRISFVWSPQRASHTHIYTLTHAERSGGRARRATHPHTPLSLTHTHWHTHALSLSGTCRAERRKEREERKKDVVYCLVIFFWVGGSML